MHRLRSEDMEGLIDPVVHAPAEKPSWQLRPMLARSLNERWPDNPTLHVEPDPTESVDVAGFVFRVGFGGVVLAAVMVGCARLLSSWLVG
jgi:hypothetical protein